MVLLKTVLSKHQVIRWDLQNPRNYPGCLWSNAGQLWNHAGFVGNNPRFLTSHTGLFWNYPRPQFNNFGLIWNKPAMQFNYPRFLSNYTGYLVNSKRSPLNSQDLWCCYRRYLCIKYPLNSKQQNNVINFGSALYLEDLYNDWSKDPKSVHQSWDQYFQNLSLEQHQDYSKGLKGTKNPSTRTFATNGCNSDQLIKDYLTLQNLIDSYQTRGHMASHLDPLGTMFTDNQTTISDKIGHPPDEVIRSLKIPDMDKIVKLPPETYIGGKDESLPMKEIIKRLELVYCRHIGFEYTHLLDPVEIDWIRKRIEYPEAFKLDHGTKKRTLKNLIKAFGLESYLMKKWPGEKRFGLEGGESLIPCLQEIIDCSCDQGVETIGIAMAHRGRLNVLVNVCRKPLEEVFAQFVGVGPATEKYSGDVKYHLGLETIRTNNKSGKNYKISLIANPSHLECSAPILAGKIKSEQFFSNDPKGDKSLGIIVHGDAAVAGQGVTFETVHLSSLPCFNTGGSIHVVVNNQVGFTTDPRDARSSPYCTDVAQSIMAPIFHVNGDDPESVVFVSQLASDYRAKFHKDVFIDIVCYRKLGHNELDQPAFTQPLMYKKISALKPVSEIYQEQLIKEGVLTQDDAQKIRQAYVDVCDQNFEKAKTLTSINYTKWIDSPWKGFFKKDSTINSGDTGVKEDVIKHIAKAFSTPPPNELKFEIHKGLERVLKARLDMFEKKETDFSMGEALAFATLLKDGIHIRLTGQDCERGTFSNRHHLLHHQSKPLVKYNVLSNLFPDQANYVVCNSSLSEYAVMGFQLGYGLTNPMCLALWEAQFGDFNNTAQVIIDQFIAAGEQKWVRQNGIVLILPHGYEGQGPEHSSGRIERFLQLTDEDVIEQPRYDQNFADLQLQNVNWFVANLTTPANLFHLYRRHLKLPFRKPLIYFSPKSLLKKPEAISHFSDYLEGTKFLRLIPESGPASKSPKDVRKLVFCSGKIYYDIVEALTKAKVLDKVAVARVEQIAPFPYDLVQQEAEKYSSAMIVWAQEEPKNMGAWTYCRDRIEAATQKGVCYVGRACSASPATGNKVIHTREVEEIEKDIVWLP